jgi:hypothetical protein
MNERIALLAADPETPEKPWQRLAVLLFSNGTPIVDIANELAKEVKEVSSFITSPKGALLLKTVVGDNEDRLEDIIQAAAIDSVLALVRIRDTAPMASAQVSAACQLLDRATPKVKSQDQKQRKQRRSNDFTKVSSEILALREELSGEFNA